VDRHQRLGALAAREGRCANGKSKERNAQPTTRQTHFGGGAAKNALVPQHTCKITLLSDF
jgi:hypothetical protein